MRLPRSQGIDLLDQGMVVVLLRPPASATAAGLAIPPLPSGHKRCVGCKEGGKCFVIRLAFVVVVAVVVVVVVVVVSSTRVGAGSGMI
jgi:hypothetical protein